MKDHRLPDNEKAEVKLDDDGYSDRLNQPVDMEKLIYSLLAEIHQQNEFNRQLSMHTAVSHRSRIAEAVLARMDWEDDFLVNLANGVIGATIPARAAVRLADALLEELAK